MPDVLSETMLHVWELGRAASPGERGLILLRLAAPGSPEAELAELTVGQRDAALLDVFERNFGGAAPALADCPAGGETLELDVPLGAIRAQKPQAAAPRVLAWAGREIAYRLPNAGDLAALDVGSVEDAARWLARRCVGNGALDDEAADALEQALDAAVLHDDPQAVVTLDFDCPACGRGWASRFDIVEFLWRRIERFADDLLRDVHALASAYGWSERDILALPTARRRHYLGLLGE